MVWNCCKSAIDLVTKNKTKVYFGTFILALYCYCGENA